MVMNPWVAQLELRHQTPRADHFVFDYSPGDLLARLVIGLSFNYVSVIAINHVAWFACSSFD